MYVLKLDENNRILSISEKIEGKNYKGKPIVEKRPEDLVPADATEEVKDAHNYLYIEGEYIYDPLPRPDNPEPDPIPGEDLTADEMAAAIMEGVNEV